MCLGRRWSTPPAAAGGRRRGGRGHVKHGTWTQGRADVVEVDAQQDQQGVEGEAEAQGPGAAAPQEEAQPVDQPAGGDREPLPPA